MPSISKELVSAMRYLLPASRTKRLIRMAKPEASGGTIAENIIAEIPRAIVRAHCLNRQEYAELGVLMQDKPIGFRFPNWRTATFSKRIKSEWLIEDGKQVFDYCYANDLRPGFGNLYEGHGWMHHGHIANGPCCKLMIRWQRAHLDRVLNLKLDPLVGAYIPGWDDRSGAFEEVGINQLVRRAAAVREQRAHSDAERAAAFERDMDEESDEIAKAYKDEALRALHQSADDGLEEAVIFTASASAVNPELRFGTSLDCARHGLSRTYRDYRLFDQPKCWEGVVARGLCRRFKRSGFGDVEIRISEVYPQSYTLKLVIPFVDRVS